MTADAVTREQLGGAAAPAFGFLDQHLSAVSLVAGAVLWEVVGRAADLLFLPPLSAVAARLVELTVNGRILGNLFNSLQNLAIGYAIALIIGLGIGMLMGAYPKVESSLDLYVTALNSTPSLVFAPIFFTFFGLSRWSIVALIVLSTSIFLIINTAAAIRAVSPELIEMARSFNAGDRQLFRKILFPAALPFILGTARLAAGRGVKAMINGEMFIAAIGLGGIVIQAGGAFDTTTVLAVLMLIGAVGFGVLGILRVIEARLTSWLPADLSAAGRM